MTAVVVKRPARRPAPELPAGELVLEAPPEIPAPAGKQWTQALTMLPMVVIMAAFALMFSGSAAGPLRLVVFALFGVALLVMLVVAVVRGGGASGAEMAHARRGYLRRLAQHRRRLRRSVERQRESLAYLHPEPDQLWAIAGGSRLWERRAEDADFAVVRVGSGPGRPETTLVVPATKPLESLDPLTALALRRFLTAYAMVPDLPLAVPLTGFGRIHLLGDRARTTGLARAMLAQLATAHAPDDVLIAVCRGNRQRPDWEWVKWLPHALHPTRADAAGPLRLVAPTVAGLEAMVTDLIAVRPRLDPDGPRGVLPQIVVVLDGGELTGSEHLLAGSGVEGVTVLDLSTAPGPLADRSTLVLEVGATLVSRTIDGRRELGRPDALEPVLAEALARRLAPLRLSDGPAETALAGDLGLAELLGIADPYSFDPEAGWAPRPERDRLRVMFGVSADGTPVELDLKESSEDGMGPHGLLIGATGSGKSELLRTLVLGLAATHSPASLNFVLVDFKGGATFTRMDALPHTSAVITNLREKLPLVDRMTDALNGELIRRQEILRAAGNFSSVRDYERARLAGAALPELPTLLVICDEFSELLREKPDFIETFVQIGRLGRSLGVHLLLASQRLEEGRLRGLDGHLSYRIGLRTFAATESRAVLGVTDAFELPRAPGHALMRYGTEPLTRFRAAYVSGIHRRPAATPHPPAGVRIVEFTTDHRPDTAPDAPQSTDSTGESLLDILVDRLAGRGTPAHVVWLPPLAESPTLDQLSQPPAGTLRVAVGMVDRPLEQRRDGLELDLAGAAGHVLVTGGPRSGRSTTLRTLIATLAMTHSPREAQFYCLDFGGGSLAALRGLPHVGGVAGRQNPGAVRRTVAQLAGLLTERERRFAERDVDGMAAYRAARAAGEFADDPYGDVFLVVDGWLTIRKEFEDLEDAIADLTTRGLSYGLHVVVASMRAFDLRPAVRDLFGSRLELRLGDPADTAVDRVMAQRVPKDAPGRGLAASKHEILVALPRADGVCSVEALPAATAGLVATVAARWPHMTAPRVRLLPRQLSYVDLPERDEGPGAPRLTIGIDEQQLAPVRLDFAADPYVVLLGDSRSGKSAFVRLLARRITGGFTPEQARIVLVDHRRSLLGEIGTGHLLGHGTDPASTRRLVSEIARGMAERAPAPDVTPEQLRKRSWWRGPELFLLIDDYDLVVSPADNPLQPLLPYLPQARELGLHVVVTRRTGGAGRALFEPFLARLRDVGAPGLLLSGDRGEGPLLGGLKPESLPPGRGRLITRGQPPRMLQLAWVPPSHEDSP